MTFRPVATSSAANRLMVPCANVIVGLAARECLGAAGGRIGSVPIQRLDLAFLVHADHYRTRRWIQSSPTTSASFALTAGRWESLNVSTRCRSMPHSRRIRATDANEIPSR